MTLSQAIKRTLKQAAIGAGFAASVLSASAFAGEPEKEDLKFILIINLN